MITREQLFGSFTRKHKLVPTPIGDARIQNLNEDELCEFQRGQFTPKGELSEPYQKQKRRRLVAACLVDEAGQRICNQPGDLAKLGPVADSAVITAIFLGALEHCGLQKLEDDADDLGKNSEPAPD